MAGSVERLGRRRPVRFMHGMLVGVGMVAVQTLIVRGVGHVRYSALPVGAEPAMILVLSFLVLAAREELAFRGYLLRRLSPAFGLWPALLALAALFALEHVAG